MNRTDSGTMMGPVVTCIYGPSGGGKTTDCGYSFPNGLFLATRGALNSIYHTCGYQPAAINVRTIQEATAILTDLMKKGAKYDAIVVDDLSFLAEQTFAEVDRKFRGNNFAKWGKLNDITLEFRDVARHMNCHVIFNCWEQGPKTRTDGSFLRGGPMLSGRLVEKVPAICDQVFRVGRESNRLSWPYSYLCDRDNSKWVMKDRFNIAYGLNPAPMNMAEILRAAGFQIKRLEALKGQEEMVEQLAQHFLAEGQSPDKVNTLFANLVSKGQDPKAARWTLRDALDRAIIRRAIQHNQQRFLA